VKPELTEFGGSRTKNGVSVTAIEDTGQAQKEKGAEMTGGYWRSDARLAQSNVIRCAKGVCLL
jgi:hypothetical protein